MGKVSVGGAVHELAVGAAGAGALRLTVDGAALELRVLASDGERHLVETGDGIEELFTIRDGDATWVWHRGRARRVERVRPARPRRDPGEAAPAPAAGLQPGVPPGAITPPTAAMVIAVMVEEGQRVKAGQPLVAISAMKTETTLVSPWAGRVARVVARVGAAVRPGDELVRVEGEAAPAAAPAAGGGDGE